MKKFYTTAGILLTAATVVFGQVASTERFPANKKNNHTGYHVKKQNQVVAKNAAATIWQDDFSVAANWTISNQSGNSDNWVIGNAVPSGSFPIDPIASTSAANGYALFDSDLLCSGNQVADLTTASPINCSGHPGVLLQFQQNYRRFDDSTFVFVSTNGTNWTKFPVNALVANNDDPINPENVTVNISSVAGNQQFVWIRFEFWSPSTYTSGPGSAPGCGYSWMIDDVQLVDAPDNDLVATEAISYAYSMVPAFIGQSTDFATLISNNGGQAATNAKLNVKVNKGTTNVYDQTSTPVASFASGSSDTLFVTAPYAASEVGSYSVEFTVSADATDATPTDNVITHNFAITDSVYAVDGGFNATVSGISNGVETGTTNSQPYKIGNYYEVTSQGDVTATSITFALVNSTANMANTVGEVIRAVLYEVDSTVTTSLAANEVAASAEMTIAQNQVTDLSTGTSFTYITLPLTDPYVISANADYIATVEYLGNSGGKQVFVATSEPSLYKYPGVSFIYDETATNPGWYYYGSSTPVVRLNLDGPIGINEVNALSASLNIYPNPSNGPSTITYELKENSDVMVKIVDITGKTVMSLNQGRQTNGVHNVSVDLSSLPTGMYAYNVTAGNFSATKSVIVK